MYLSTLDIQSPISRMQVVRCGPYVVLDVISYTCRVWMIHVHKVDIKETNIFTLPWFYLSFIQFDIITHSSIIYATGLWWLHSESRMWKWTIAVTIWPTFDSFVLIFDIEASGIGYSYSNRSENEYAVNGSISLGLNIIIHIHNNVICFTNAVCSMMEY